jgi:hypothetical protein
MLIDIQSNVYIDEDSRAVLGDFGLTAITDIALQGATTTVNKAGACRWLSAEVRKHALLPAPWLKGHNQLIYQGEDTPPRKTTSGDIFAFGRLCLSVRKETSHKLTFILTSNDTGLHPTFTIPLRRCRHRRAPHGDHP